MPDISILRNCQLNVDVQNVKPMLLRKREKIIDYRIYYKACDADRLFHNSLVEDVGEYRAGDARYDTTQTGWSTKTKYLCARARRAKERWHNHCEKHSEESRRVAGPENNNKGI